MSRRSILRLEIPHNHAGFVKLERRFSHGFSLLAHYTFSKFLDDVAAATEFGDPGSYLNLYNRGLDKGRSGSDLPQRAVITGIYSLPQLTGNRALHTVASGWQIGVLANLQSGQVFTVYDSVNNSNAFPSGTTRPNLIGDPPRQARRPCSAGSTAEHFRSRMSILSAIRRARFYA